MTLRALDRTMTVGFAAFPVLCPERSLAEFPDVYKLPQQLAALLDEVVVIAGRHARPPPPPSVPRYRKQTS